MDAVKEEKILYYRSSLKNQEGTWQKRGGGVLRWVDTPIHTMGDGFLVMEGIILKRGGRGLIHLYGLCKVYSHPIIVGFLDHQYLWKETMP